MRYELATVSRLCYASLFEALLQKMKPIPTFQLDHVYVHKLAIYVWVKSQVIACWLYGLYLHINGGWIQATERDVRQDC